jgi:hypothetical protein
MPYLVAIHHPDDYDPAIAEDEEMERDIDDEVRFGKRYLAQSVPLIPQLRTVYRI